MFLVLILDVGNEISSRNRLCQDSGTPLSIHCGWIVLSGYSLGWECFFISFACQECP